MSNFTDGAPRTPREWYELGFIIIPCTPDGVPMMKDWQKEIKVGNMTRQTLKEVWLGEKLNIERRRLIKGDRSKSPCNKCSVNGQLFGKPSFNILKKTLI